jgi:actin-like ATPase involved in cell morphogenesis
MRQIILVFTIVALAGCGADTMSAAATSAVLKKQEIEQGKKTMEQMQQKIGEAMKQAEQRAQQAIDTPEK